MVVGPITRGQHFVGQLTGQLTSPLARHTRRRQWQRRYRRTLLVADGCAALFAAVLIHGAYGRWAVLLGLPPAWLCATAAYRAYDPDSLGTGSEEFRRVLRAAVALPAVAASCYWFVLRDSDFLHDMLLAVVPVALFALAVRLVMRHRLSRQWARQQDRSSTVLVGSAAGVKELLPTLAGPRPGGLAVTGVCLTDPENADELGPVWAERVWGGLSTLPKALHDIEGTTVVVAPTPEIGPTELRRLSWSVAAAGADFLLASVPSDVAPARLSVRIANGVPLLGLRAPRLSQGPRLPKELLERTFAGVLLLALAPLMLAVALLVRLDSTGPAFFRQRRVGLYGDHFTMFKFRTMRTDAEDRKAALEHENQNSDGLLFKIKEDPRVTRVGSALRRYSIDELPQLINVLTGRMSLVGPRPSLPSEADGYTNEIRRRLLVKPGLTGLWQVSGRSDLPWEEAVRLDLSYVDNWSLSLDAEILWRTGPAVLRGTGAY